jgi:hypothetical protein
MTSWRPSLPWASTWGCSTSAQKTNVVYAISDKPMSAEEWSKRHVTLHRELSGPPSDRNGQYRHGERHLGGFIKQRLDRDGERVAEQ